MSLKSKFLAAIAIACLSFSASASVVTFNAAPSTQGGTYDGFTLSSNIYFHDAGRPYLEYWSQAHTITANGTFTFNSIDFNYDPWQGYNGGSNSQLHIQFLGSTNNVLLDTIIGIPTNRSWLTYSNTVAGVHQIVFLATNGFWPSFDNLTYNETPEPESIALLGLGLLGLLAARRKQV